MRPSQDSYPWFGMSPRSGLPWSIRDLALGHQELWLLGAEGRVSTKISQGLGLSPNILCMLLTQKCS